MNEKSDPLKSNTVLKTHSGSVRIARLSRLAELGIGDVDRLPFSRKVLLECALRNLDGFLVTQDHVRALADPNPRAFGETEVPFLPALICLDQRHIGEEIL